MLRWPGALFCPSAPPLPPPHFDCPHQVVAEPAWSVDGWRLFYRAGGRFIAARVAASPALDVVSRKELFEDHYRAGLFRSRFDVHPDGKHFIVLQPSAESPEVVVAVNWATDLRSRLMVSPSASRP
jgi:hypothetical protein